jgi:hypothetical protein
MEKADPHRSLAWEGWIHHERYLTSCIGSVYTVVGGKPEAGAIHPSIERLKSRPQKLKYSTIAIRSYILAILLYGINYINNKTTVNG